MAKWVTFSEPVKLKDYHTAVRGVCVEGPKGLEIAEAIGGVLAVDSLPYPADPRIKTGEDSCPSFCMQPQQCKGRTSCPRNYACSE